VNILIATDMEGIAGIESSGDCLPSHPSAYARGDGQSLNEVQVYAQGLAAEGIPVLLASGDRWMLEELGEGELGSAKLVASKEGQERGRASSREVNAVRAELAASIAAAWAEPLRPPPARSYPAELRITACEPCNVALAVS
jgi:D-aminopeptidase